MAYDKIGAGCAYALFHYGLELKERGIPVELSVYTGNCHVDDGRNRLVRDFLKSDCTDMVFLDADVGGPASNLIDLLGYDADVVAGVYPKKGDDTYPVKLLPGEIKADWQGLIEVQGLPTGFMRIRREVLERLVTYAVAYNAKNDADSAIPLIFERQVHDGTRWGGDYVFCRKWRALGGKVHMAPEMRFEHSGEHTWTGCVGSWLKQKYGTGLAPALQTVREGRETAETLAELHEMWGNPFSAPPVLLGCLALIARNAKGPAFEFGSGLSTLVMAAAGGSVVALEQNPIYADHTREQLKRYGLIGSVKYAPLVDGWYDETIVPQPGGLVFIDGPRRDADRMGVFDRVDLSKSIVVADDVQRDGGMPEIVERLMRTHRVEVLDELGRRKFCVAVPK